MLLKLEHAMRRVDGVISTTSGYTGGRTDAPTHSAVSTGRTGHVEAVRVVFDPRRVSYGQLLDVFWLSHDPALFGPQEDDVGADEGLRPSGGSIIFYHDESQRAAAEASKAGLAASGRFSDPVPAEVLPATVFHRAEPEHQQYLEKHGRGGACRLD